VVSSTNKTDHRDNTEILLKVALNTITLTIYIGILHKENSFFLRLVYPMLQVSLDCPFLMFLRYSCLFAGNCSPTHFPIRSPEVPKEVLNVPGTQNVKTHNRTTQKTKKMSNMDQDLN
jgi:hypothetical protein